MANANGVGDSSSVFNLCGIARATGSSTIVGNNPITSRERLHHRLNPLLAQVFSIPSLHRPICSVFKIVSSLIVQRWMHVEEINCNFSGPLAEKTSKSKGIVKTSADAPKTHPLSVGVDVDWEAMVI
jgi:hypothetical protein